MEPFLAAQSEIIVGLIINIYVIYLVWSANGKFVFSPEYERSLLKRRTSYIERHL